MGYGVITVEGDLADDDVVVNLTTQGSTTAPSRNVPAGCSKISKIIVAAGFDLAAAGSAGAMLRLTGDGVKEGDQTIAVAGAGGTAEQAGSDAQGLFMNPLVLENVDIEVTAGDIINIQAEMLGDDLGDAHICVTLIFS